MMPAKMTWTPSLLARGDGHGCWQVGTHCGNQATQHNIKPHNDPFDVFGGFGERHTADSSTCTKHVQWSLCLFDCASFEGQHTLGRVGRTHRGGEMRSSSASCFSSVKQIIFDMSCAS